MQIAGINVAQTVGQAIADKARTLGARNVQVENPRDNANGASTVGLSFDVNGRGYAITVSVTEGRDTQQAQDKAQVAEIVGQVTVDPSATVDAPKSEVLGVLVEIRNGINRIAAKVGA